MGPITLPQAIPLSTATLQLTPGTYSELVADTWNGQDVDTDPALASADHAASLIGQMGTELPGGSDLVTHLGNMGAKIPAKGASTFSTDMAAAQAAQDVKTQAVSDAIGTIPPILELPMDPAGFGQLSSAPIILAIDLGNVSINKPILPQFIGDSNTSPKRNSVGIMTIFIADSQGIHADIRVDETEIASGAVHDKYFLVGTPTALGAAVVQVNYNTEATFKFTEATYKMTVVP